MMFFLVVEFVKYLLQFNMGNKKTKVRRVMKRKFGGNQFTRRDAEKLLECSNAKKLKPAGKVG